MAEDFGGGSRGVDLFGQPIPATRDGPGRPAHAWTIENSNKINLLFAVGRQPKEVAMAIGVSLPTLRKHYFAELAQWAAARLKLEAVNLVRLNKEAEAGNVAAIKELNKRIDRGALLTVPAAPDRAPRLAKPGKKEQRKAAALTAHAASSWDDLLPPAGTLN